MHVVKQAEPLPVLGMKQYYYQVSCVLLACLFVCVYVCVCVCFVHKSQLILAKFNCQIVLSD